MGSLCTHASGWYKGNPSLCAHLVFLQLQCVQETNPQGGSYSIGGSSGSAAGAPPITQPPPIGEALSNTIDLLAAPQQQPPLQLPVILPVPPLQPAQAHTPPAQPVAAPQVDTPPLADAATVEPSSSEASSGDGDGADSNVGTDGDSSSSRDI